MDRFDANVILTRAEVQKRGESIPMSGLGSHLKEFVSRIYGESKRAPRERTLYENNKQPEPGMVRGRLVVLRPNGFGIVRLEGNREGFFSSLDMSAPKARARGSLREGCRVEGRIKAETTEVISQEQPIHLVEVSRY